MNNNAITNINSIASKRWFYVFLLTVFLLAVGLRIACAFHLSPKPVWPDGKRYNEIAESILQNGEYPVNESHSAPLLPIVLAIIYKLVHFNGTAARIIFAIFGILTCGIIYLLGKRLFGKHAGIIAALILAIYPLHAYMSSIYEYPQTLFILLICMAVYQLISSTQKDSLRFKICSSGFLFGLAVLAVPTIITALPFLALWIVFVSKQDWRSRVLNAVLFTIGCSIIVLSWSAYVYAGTGKFQLGSGTGAETLFKGNCSLAWQMGKADIADRYEIEGVPPEHKQAYDEYKAVEQQARQFPAGQERNAVYKNAVKQFFTERPREAALLLVRKAALYWCPFALTVTKSEHNNNLTKIIQIISFTPVFVLALVGIYIQRDKLIVLMPIYIIIITQWITYSIYIVNARYRSQIDVFLIALATPVLITLIRKIGHIKI